MNSTVQNAKYHMSNPMHSKPQQMFCFLLYYDAPFTQKDRHDDMYTSIT